MKKQIQSLYEQILAFLLFVMLPTLIVIGIFLLVISTNVHATELKTTLTSNPNIEEMIARYNGVDPLDKLAWAVAEHETHNCEDDTNFTRVNNCHGIRKWRNGKLQPARYETKEESYDDFKDIWGRMYKTRVPTRQDALKWSGNDNADAWYVNVTHLLTTI